MLHAPPTRKTLSMDTKRWSVVLLFAALSGLNAWHWSDHSLFFGAAAFAVTAAGIVALYKWRQKSAR